MDLPEETRGIRSANRRKPPEVPGGKALARIQYFRLQRGLPRPQPPKAKGLAPRVPKRTKVAANATAKAADARAFFKAQRRKAGLAATPRATLPTWVELGPRSIPLGQTYGDGGNNRPPVSGRIASVAVDPTNGNRILIASAGGGIWESQTRGATWQPLTDFEMTLSMGALAFAPSDPLHVYAGTGEGDTWSPLGMGIMRSTDGGTSWSLMGSSTFTGLAVYDIAIDPTDHRHLWVATTQGLFESTNGGTTWTQTWTQQTWDLSVAPDGSGEIFACCPASAHLSTNNGKSWKKVPLPGAPAEFDRMEVCHAPSDTGVVFVFACAKGVGYLWRRATVGGAFGKEPLPGKLDTAQGWYDWCAVVHPTNADVLYVGAIELYRGARKANGTWKWENISSRSTGDSIHPDQHHLFVTPVEPDTVYIANDGGLFRSPDTGGTWEALNTGLGITEFEFLAQHPSNLTWMIGGTQDNGTLRLGTGGLVWNQVAYGDGGDCGINESAPLVCYHSYYGLGFEVSLNGGGWNSWTYRDPTKPGDVALFYPPLEVLNDLLTQAGSVVYITEDQGASFERISLPIIGGKREVASALAVPNADTIVVGTTRLSPDTPSGNIYQIERKSGIWRQPTKLTRPRPGYVSDIVVDPSDLRRIWVSYSTIAGGGHLYLSTDGGGTWVDRSTKLPKIAVNAIVVDPADANTIYVGTDNGVYKSDDEGKTWVDFSNSLPNTLVGDLLFHAGKRILRAGTRNRGVWQVQL